MRHRKLERLPPKKFHDFHTHSDERFGREIKTAIAPKTLADLEHIVKQIFDGKEGYCKTESLEPTDELPSGAKVYMNDFGDITIVFYEHPIGTLVLYDACYTPPLPPTFGAVP